MRGVCLGIALAFALAMLGCAQPTEITLELTTDAPCNGTVSVTVGSSLTNMGADASASTATCANGSTGTIGTLVIVPSGADNASVAIAVTLDENDGGTTCDAGAPGCIVALRSLSFVPHQNIVLPVALSKSCAAMSCPAGETCVDGTCVAATIQDPKYCASEGCSLVASSDGGPGDAGPDDVGQGDSGQADGASPDGLSEASLQDGSTMDSSSADATPPSGGVMVPALWSLVGLDTTMTSSCPAGYDPAANVVADPVVSTSLCTYGCEIGGAPSCTAGTLNVSYSISGGVFGCGIPAGDALAETPGCQTTSVTEPIQYSSPTNATNNDCTATATPKGMLPFNAHVCSNPSTAICNGSTCYPNLVSPLQVCVTTTGSSSMCPPGFPHQHEVSLSGVVSCTAAGCSVTATCSGTVELFQGSNCGGTPFPVPADGTCNPLPQNETFQSYMYRSSSNVSCAYETPPLPTLASATSIVCCQ